MPESQINNYEAYRAHLKQANDPLDRREEDKILRRCGMAKWAMEMRAYLLGHHNLLGDPLTPVASAHLLQHLELSYNDQLVLDEVNRKEYFRIKLEELLLQEKRKANEKAAAILVMEDCQNFGGWT